MRYIDIVSHCVTCLLLTGALVFSTAERVWAADSIAQVEAATTDSAGTLSQIEDDETGDDDSSTASAWRDFVPPPDSEFDWIQLTSNEWLKGELRVLYSFKLEFDSDELGLLSFDWDDVKQVRTAGPQAVRLEDPANGYTPITVFGVLTIVDGAATVETGEGIRQFDRNKIISIATGTRREADFWSGKVSLGANLRRGNSDLVDATLTATLKRRRAVSRVLLEYIGNYSRAESTTTSNNHRLNGHYDIFKTTRYFWRPILGEYFRNTFQNIEHQATLGTGGGYHIIRSPKTEWDVTGAVGVLYKQYASVIPGRDIDNVSPALGAGTRYDTEITSWLDYLLDFSFQVVDEESGTYIHHLITTLSSDIIGDVDLDVSLVWDRVQDPEPAADGTVPEQDDFQLIVAIGYDF